jgi:GTP-binding protein
VIKGLVAIVGRPNVGKSTLFNRLTHSDTAIVDDRPGVTRDRLYGTAFYDKNSETRDGFMVIDTGGFETEKFNFQPFAENLVWKQTQLAITEADLVIFLLDGKHGVHQHDYEISRYLELQKKAVIFVVNKVDGIEKREELLWDFYGFGINELHPISAAHNRGVKDLFKTIQGNLRGVRKGMEAFDSQLGTKVAIIGRPNAGKSSILNRLVGEDRAVVSEIAGTTRDSLDAKVTYNQQDYIFIDTAGIRRRTRVKESLEVQSVVRSLRNIERADIVLLVIDALDGITDQDARLANLVVGRHKPLLIVVNKWDLVPEKETHTARNYEKNIKLIFQDNSYIPVVFISCLENQRVHKILGVVDHLLAQTSTRIPTARINEALQTMIAEHTPQLIRKYNKRVKFFYATQVRANPPTIVVKCNISDEIQTSYKRYMLNKFRDILGFDQVPVRLLFRGKADTEKAQRSEEYHIEKMTEEEATGGGLD